jgi:hypothetical protein
MPVLAATSYSITALGTLAGGAQSVAHGLNALGWVVGSADTSAGDFHAFLATGEARRGSEQLGRLSERPRGRGRQRLPPSAAIGGARHARQGRGRYGGEEWYWGCVRPMNRRWNHAMRHNHGVCALSLSLVGGLSARAAWHRFLLPATAASVSSSLAGSRVCRDDFAHLSRLLPHCVSVRPADAPAIAVGMVIRSGVATNDAPTLGPNGERALSNTPPMFNYTHALECLIAEIVERVPEFGHVEAERLLVACARSKDNGPIGSYAKIVPMRFEKGARERRIGRLVYEMRPLSHGGRDILYLIYFFLPRFGDLPYRQGLETVVHELYHISTDFDGDIRRFPGRNYAHGSSQKRFNAAVAAVTERYLAAGEPTAAAFLQHTTTELRRAHGSLVGRRVTLPRPVRKG